MTSELELYLVGVEFIRDASGRIATVRGPDGTDVRATVVERMDLVRARLHGGPDRSGDRRGTCDTCGKALGLLCHCAFCTKRPPAECWKKHGSSSNRAGICWLCECALQKIVAAGEWPPQRIDTHAVVDIEALIAALPPKPKAPWETDA